MSYIVKTSKRTVWRPDPICSAEEIIGFSHLISEPAACEAFTAIIEKSKPEFFCRLMWLSLKSADLRPRKIASLTRPYFVAETSTSTRRSGCKQAINALVALLPLQSPGLVTGSAPSTPLAAILPDGTPPDCTR